MTCGLPGPCQQSTLIDCGDYGPCSTAAAFHAFRLSVAVSQLSGIFSRIKARRLTAAIIPKGAKRLSVPMANVMCWGSATIVQSGSTR